MTEDDKDFELFKGKFMAEHQNKFTREEFNSAEPIIYWAFIEARRTLREKVSKQTKDIFPPINTTGGQGSGPI